MARHNKAVTGVVAWRRKREIKECPESSLELRRRREQRLVRSASLAKLPFRYYRVSKRIASILRTAISMGTNSILQRGQHQSLGWAFTDVRSPNSIL